MKIQTILTAAYCLMLAACTEREEVPEGDTVLASRSADSVKTEWQRPREAVLRILLDADRPTACLTGMTVRAGDDPETALDAGRLMTHPLRRDITLRPRDGQTVIGFEAVLDDTLRLTARTVVHSVRAGTRIQANLAVEGGRLRVIGSWTEECTEEAEPWPAACDSILPGDFLHTDGSLSREYRPTAAALVVWSDGRHGRAVALHDSPGQWIFSPTGASSGLPCETIDGRTCEGLLNPRRSAADSTASLFYHPSLPYPEGCAFHYRDGYLLTSRIRDSRTDAVPLEGEMLRAALLRDGSYVPSAAEMADLYLRVNGIGCPRTGDFRFDPPQGVYLTSSESSEDTFYCVDFTGGTMTGHASKRCLPLRLRLFYIF